MKHTFFRITPKRTLILNNRWYDRVSPKNTFFFLPANKEQIELWKYFLCTTHHKTFVFLHECFIDCVNYRYRRLTFYRGVHLYEILIKSYNLTKITDVKVLKIYKERPITLKYLPKILDYDFSPHKARKMGVESTTHP